MNFKKMADDAREMMGVENDDGKEVSAITESIHVREGKTYSMHPMTEDLFHMGTQLGSNVFAMFANHAKDPMSYVILVNLNTGESVKVYFADNKTVSAQCDCIMCEANRG